MKSMTPLLLVPFSIACVGAAQEDSVHKTIKINMDSFSEIYPAVWFSPSDGTITPLTEKSETPPKPIFKIWIEPRDPEISTLDRKTTKEGKQGFRLIGHGKEHFKNPVPPKEKKLTNEIRAADLKKPLAVFLYVDGTKSYVMLVESLSKDKQELTFHWKSLGSNQ